MFDYTGWNDQIILCAMYIPIVVLLLLLTSDDSKNNEYHRRDFIHVNIY